jgi:hypothetical protein
MRRGRVLGVGALALSAITAVPASAAVLEDQASLTVQGASTGVGAASSGEPATSQSTLGLLGTGATFLLVGVGSLNVAHRRRWTPSDLPA